WDWNGGLPAADVAMVQALRLFCEFEHHANVPQTHRENGLELGRWVWAVRRRNLTGRLHPALEEEIAAATPRGHKGCPSFKWHVAEPRWRIAYSALRAYAGREGHAAPPCTHQEKLPDATVGLGQWAGLQRFLHRRGRLEQRYVTLLDAVPGWAWDAPGVARPYGEPVDLGGDWHGRAKGAAAGCSCEDCTELRRGYGRRHLARRRAIPGGVPAGRSRQKINRLRAAGASLTAIEFSSGVPLGVLR